MSFLDVFHQWPLRPKERIMRYIGIRHRVKRTVEGEARPTQVVILGESEQILELANDLAELDFACGTLPVEWRPITREDRIEEHPTHHLKWRSLREDDTSPEHHHHEIGDKIKVATKIPVRYEGLREGDVIAMVLGGLGDKFAFALSRWADEFDHTSVVRIPPSVLQEERQGPKEEDARNLAELAKRRPDLFYRTAARDRDLIWTRECLFLRMCSMKARIGCELRLRQQFIGRIFCSEAGGYPQGNIQLLFDQEKANDQILQGLLEEERRRDADLRKAVRKLQIWTDVFEPIEGCGERIAADIIGAIGDIRRFPTPAKLKAFLGVHVRNGGKHGDVPTRMQFPRQRHGEVANWTPEGRQALYLLAEQFNYRPNSTWGMKLRENKVRLREKHPEVVEVGGKKRYTNAHIHKMAIWRTLSQFTVWLWRAWWDTERQHQRLAA